MKHITYLFGAGASCGVLPLNKDIPARLFKLIEELKKIRYTYGEDNQLKENLITDLQWLYTESDNHASVDTFAKKLYIKQQWQELKRLRLALSVFFVCEQLRKIPDKRYDSF